MTRWTIREERPEDADAIGALTTAAFAAMPWSDGSEAALVARLRADGDLVLSLIATDGDAVIGHVGFSPLRIDGHSGGWFQLAPLSVAPARQRAGIGTALAQEGIAMLRRRGARGIGVLGDPAYYERLGFTRHGGLGMAGEHADYYRWLVLEGDAPQGEVSFAAAFG